MTDQNHGGDPDGRQNQADLIAAIATATGPGAVSVVRLSGFGADKALAQVFVAHLDPAKNPRAMVYGQLVHPQSKELIDRVLAVYFPAPHSFTGEDSAEIFGHGGSTVPRLILEAVLAAGARLANPGEFTQRAFLNDRLSLDQAEAVADLVAAQSEAEAALAVRHLEGTLSAKIKPVIDQTVDLQAELVAILDFEEDWDDDQRDRIIASLGRVYGKIFDLAEKGKNLRVFRDGLRIVLTGLPNAGKSSLFNALLGRDRALVSPRPGTTRDYLEAMVSWDGLRVELVDTAGLGSESGAESGAGSGDELEGLGQALALRELKDADVIVRLRSITQPGPDQAPQTWDGEKILTVWSKTDLAPGPLPQNSLGVSALTGEGLDALKQSVLKKVGLVKGLKPEIVPNLRQRIALEAALERIGQARQALLDRLPPDIAALEVSLALESLNRITGRVLTDDILSQVFEKFCLGK
ncbi:MAG: tRNA uridine-5-carboxymethylaminomethyl(34) synthesis GTPase MnmE [Deltaproteobacteria bacterium]|nr:tRNA uridine-5-carboxymethylaminomethyl(34) synthesis GTPase MnmE [Deltaproteobacteria bacterium]